MSKQLLYLQEKPCQSKAKQSRHLNMSANCIHIIQSSFANPKLKHKSKFLSEKNYSNSTTLHLQWQSQTTDLHLWSIASINQNMTKYLQKPCQSKTGDTVGSIFKSWKGFEKGILKSRYLALPAQKQCSHGSAANSPVFLCHFDSLERGSQPIACTEVFPVEQPNSKH